MRHILSVGIVAAAFFAVAALNCAPASADFQVCNESGEHISIAIAYFDNDRDSFVSRGWWNMDSGECKTPVSGNLKDKYYYLYADGDQHTWTGQHSLCINPTLKFTYYNADTECDYSWEKFFRVDTGDAETYTHTIR